MLFQSRHLEVNKAQSLKSVHVDLISRMENKVARRAQFSATVGLRVIRPRNDKNFWPSLLLSTKQCDGFQAPLSP